MNIWMYQHQAALQTAWGRLWRTPLNTLLALLVMGVALTLPAGGAVFLEKLAILGERAASAQQMSVFMDVNASARDVAAIESKLKMQEGITRWKFVSKEAAWRELQQKPGMSDVLVGMGRNPLPDAFVVDARGLSPTQMTALKQRFQSWSNVAHVQLDAQWIQRLNAILEIGQQTVWMLAVLFSAGLVAIVFNTIRLQVLAQSEEIAVSRLIGATDAFVRRPFAYAGALQGLLGSVFAIVLLTLALLKLEAPVDALVGSYGEKFVLGGLSASQIGGVLLIGTGLGWLGAWLSVSLSLRQAD